MHIDQIHKRVQDVHDDLAQTVAQLEHSLRDDVRALDHDQQVTMPIRDVEAGITRASAALTTALGAWHVAVRAALATVQQAPAVSGPVPGLRRLPAPVPAPAGAAPPIHAAATS